ncbi:MAG: tetratricopeptide repeat protein [Acidobacteriaceae bacterium]|nr:tetratricopeptide repeat protein [Acidobacteriaceae bacterium]
MKFVLALACVSVVLFTPACSKSPQRLLADANQYHQQKKYKQASILYQKVIAKDRTNAEAYYREGLNLMDMNDPVNAIKYLRRAVDLKPDNLDAISKLVELELAIYSTNPQKLNSFLADARDLTTKMLALQPNSFDGLRLQGLIDLADNNVPKALETFQKANEIKPHSRELVGWYAQALVSAQHVGEADALIRDMLANDKTWGPGYDFLFVQYSRANQADRAEAILRERLQNDPPNPIAMSNLANFLLATNRYPEAESVMRSVLTDKKDFPTGREMMGDFYVRAKKFDAARQQYQAGIDENPKGALRYKERIVALDDATGQVDQAFRLAKDLAHDNPKDAAANELYAGLMLKTAKAADLPHIAAEMQRIVEDNPGDATLHFDFARTYFGQQKMDKALTEALSALRENGNLAPARVLAARVYEDRGDHAKALEQADLVLNVEPGNADARLIRDRALVATGQMDKAEPELEALLERYPLANDARLQLAAIYVSRKQFDQANQEYSRMWSSNPPDVRGYIGLQTVKLTQGEPGQAVQAMKDLVNKNPQSVPLRFELANFEATAAATARNKPDQSKQLFQEAADNFKEILKTNPQSGDIWLRLGIMQRELGQADAALASFQQASAVSPQNANAYLNEALLLDALGRKKEAAEQYNKVLAIDSQNTLALNNLAFLNAEAGTNLDQAMTFAERAKKQLPDSPDISDTLGYVYYQKNLNDAALNIFKQIVVQAPQNPTFRLHLAMALLKEGDKQGARLEAEKALKVSTLPQQQEQIRTFVSQIG